MARLEKRLVQVLHKFTERIKSRQTLSMRKLANSRREEVQFGRFLSNQRVSVPLMETTLYEQCQQAVPPGEHLLLLEDTSQMAFSMNRIITGLGKVDKGIVQGFYIHPVLALSAANGACYGIPAVEFRVRPLASDGLTYRQRRTAGNHIAFEEKESYRWRSSIETALAHLPPHSPKTVIADREGDIYGVLVGLQQDLGVDYLIRSRVDRILDGGQKLYQTLAQQPLQQSYELNLPATDQRSAHQARLQVRVSPICLQRTGAKTHTSLPAQHPCWAILVSEDPATVVGQEKPLEWVLLTSHKLDSAPRSRQLIEWYKQRWQVEQLFRSLKSKCLRFESSQLSQYEKLHKLMLVALMGAVKVLQLINARDGQTNQALASVFGAAESDFLGVLGPTLEGKTAHQTNPHGVTELAYGSWVIARLGGWSGYVSQRRAGPTDFFTGLQRFYEQWQGYLLAQNSRKDVCIL